jgi:putative membrane protein
MSYLDDPRVFFAAERTALAWNRTCITLMAFGFAIERFSLFMHMLIREAGASQDRPAYWFGLVFILLGVLFSLSSSVKYARFLKTLGGAEIPPGAGSKQIIALNTLIALLGAGIAVYLLWTGGQG